MRTKSSPLTLLSVLAGTTSALLIMTGCSPSSMNHAGRTPNRTFDVNNSVFASKNHFPEAELSNENTQHNVLKNFLSDENVLKMANADNNNDSESSDGSESGTDTAGTATLASQQDEPAAEEEQAAPPEDDESTMTEGETATGEEQPTTTEDEAAAEQTSDDPYVVNSTNIDRNFRIQSDEDHSVTTVFYIDYNGKETEYVLENQIEANGFYVVSTEDLNNWDNVNDDQTVVLMKYNADGLVFVKDRMMEIELVHVPTASIKAAGVVTVAEGKITEENIDTINGAIASRALLQFGPIAIDPDRPTGVSVDVVQGTTDTLGCSRSEGSDDLGENCLFAGRDAYVTISEAVWLSRDEDEYDEDFDEEEHLGYSAYILADLSKNNVADIELGYHTSTNTAIEDDSNAVTVRDSFRRDIYDSEGAIDFESRGIEAGYAVRLVRKDVRDLSLDFVFELFNVSEPDGESGNTDTSSAGIRFELDRFVAPPPTDAEETQEETPTEEVPEEVVEEEATEAPVVELGPASDNTEEETLEEPAADATSETTEEEGQEPSEETTSEAVETPADDSTDEETAEEPADNTEEDPASTEPTGDDNR